MSETIKILQLGTEDWNHKYRLPADVSIEYAEVFEEEVKKPYDIVFVDRELSFEEVELLYSATKAYTLFFVNGVRSNNEMEEYYICRKGRDIQRQNIQNFIQNEAKNFFAGHYGEKYRHRNLAIAQGFVGSVEWNGDYSVTVSGEYGNNFNQILYWRNNIPIEKGQALEFWLEYKKDPEVEIMLSVTCLTNITRGIMSDINQKWLFTEEEMRDVIVIDNREGIGQIFASVLAKGKGRLEVIALHDRFSRRGQGTFLPGGERYVTSNREEVFAYFDPGDRKPPFNVYFSGYKTRQGFEGYSMMRKMGCPFLLISEARLEGGCVYMGEAEYENMIRDIIWKYINELNFTREQVILSGISGGSVGTLYYGCDILPHTLLLGKPVANIGNIAANERLNRPGGLPASLDILNYLCEGTDREAVAKLNAKFWNKFDKADWSKTKFVAAYMIEDDYDPDTYEMIISHLKSTGVQVYGKGIHGRHNDNTSAVVKWFSSQFKKILAEDFGRRFDK